jgi:hypothetical protein
MDSTRFDDFTRSLAGSRRSLVSGGLAVVAGRLGLSGANAKKKRKKKGKKARKPQPNAFGCLDVGQPCNGDGTQCCSGICEGTKPKKGKPDKSRCVAHDAAICRGPDSDTCTTGVAHACNSSNFSCGCLLTTGNAGFCGGPGSTCRVCSKDADCQEEFGSGAACIVFGGICDVNCPESGGTACVPPCPVA